MSSEHVAGDNVSEPPIVGGSSNMRHHLLDLGGQKLAAITANDDRPGPPVVFVHGITATVSFWLESMPEHIRNGRRWISLSLPGHFPSSFDASTLSALPQVTPSIWAEWFEVALAQLVGEETVDLVGWSTGGFTALALAAYFPQRVRSAMSISGFAIGKWLGLIGRLQRLSLSSLTRWGVLAGFGSVGRSRWLFERVVQSGTADHAAFQKSNVRLPTMDDWFLAFGQHAPAAMAGLFQKIAEFDLSDCLGRIRSPVLIAGGDLDSYIPASHTEWIADQVPGSALVIWPGCGHMFFAERTREYQELLVRWLHQVASGTF